jgi:diguanylate cyclase (GGDEF)-like protein
MILQIALLGVVAVHAATLILFPAAAIASNFCTGVAALVAALCCLWRIVRLRQRERPTWTWIAIGFFLWAIAQFLYAWIIGNNWNQSLGPDTSDLLFFDALIPFFLAISNTYEAPSIHRVLYLNLFQAALATGLTYIRVFKMPLQPAEATAALYQIYCAECLLLAVSCSLRSLTWSTLEERHRNLLLSITFWMYLPIEVLLDSPSTTWQPPPGSILEVVWHLPKGSVFELLWSVPFLFLGWQALRMPIENVAIISSERTSKAASLLMRSLSPLMITCSVFVLAVSVAHSYLYLGLGAILLLLLVQGLHSGVMQVSYLTVQGQLLSKERQLKAANIELEKKSLLDPLTGIPNRRRFDEALHVEWKRASRKHDVLAIVMLDVDYFKAVNDCHGHPYGDDCLVRIAHTLRGQLQRSVDVVARYGGEEFIVLLPDTDLEGATTLAVHMQSAIAGLEIENEASNFDQVLTVSIGVAAIIASTRVSPTELVARADYALYRAKREGRNRVCRYEESSLWQISGSGE